MDANGKAWLDANQHRIRLCRLPPYSPELNRPIEGIWKTTRKKTTHNRYFATAKDRDSALVTTFVSFQRDPSLIDGHVRGFRS